MTQVKANLKYFRLAPRKVRLVAELVKGMPVNAALKQLAFSRKRSAQPLLKLLKSAISNAKVNFQISPENLYIKEFKVDEAPMFKRRMPRARGRATIIRKRRSHVSVVLSERPKSQIPNSVPTGHLPKGDKSQTKHKNKNSKSKKFRN